MTPTFEDSARNFLSLLFKLSNGGVKCIAIKKSFKCFASFWICPWAANFTEIVFCKWLAVFFCK